MTYTKPEVAVVGDASAVIEKVGNSKLNMGGDGIPAGAPPGYDLDE